MPQLDVNGKSIEITEKGYLVSTGDWDKDVSKALAATQSIELTDEHWDVIEYLRDQYFNNGGNQPMERVILKAMAAKWGRKLKSKDLYVLFPGAPSKQGLLVSGLPATTRKGGY
jgi:TusE/DsrC/DsvC family sulfur relay protein